MTAIGIADKATLDIVKSNTDDLLVNDLFMFVGLEKLLYGNTNWINCDWFGDGSLGDVVISANTTLNGGGEIHQYNNLTINAGITLTADQAIIVVKDTLTLNGLISASGMGGQGGAQKNGVEGSSSNGNDGESTYGYGGGGGSGEGGYDKRGGNGGNTAYRRGGYGQIWSGDYRKYGEGYDSGYSVGLLDLSTLLKSGGGGGGSGYGSNDPDEDGEAGGNGGGCILIQAKNIVINSGGAIRADGLDGATSVGYGADGGGGGGGLILLQGTLTNNGTISAAGGLGTGSNMGHKGGDGVVIILEVA